MCHLHLFVLDSHLATLLESNCPFGFLLVMFPLGSSYFVFVFFPFDVSDERCGILLSIPDHCLPFYFVITRLLYGLEIVRLNENELQQLERYHLNTLRQIQSLPKRTASSAVYMLLGALPIEAEYIKAVKCFCTRSLPVKTDLCRRSSSGNWQLACAFDNVKFPSHCCTST